MESKKIILGVLAGLATGAVLGVLFAPRKGKNTRRNIMGKGAEYIHNMESLLENYIDTMTTKMENLTVEIVDLKEDIKSKAEDTIADATNIKNKV